MINKRVVSWILVASKNIQKPKIEGESDKYVNTQQRQGKHINARVIVLVSVPNLTFNIDTNRRDVSAVIVPNVRLTKAEYISNSRGTGKVLVDWTIQRL